MSDDLMRRLRLAAKLFPARAVPPVEATPTDHNVSARLGAPVEAVASTLDAAEVARIRSNMQQSEFLGANLRRDTLALCNEVDRLRAALAAATAERDNQQERAEEIEEELARVSEVLGEGPYSSVSQHAAALIAAQKAKDEKYVAALRQIYDKYDALQAELRASRSALQAELRASRSVETK